MTSQLQEITAAYTSGNARITPAPTRVGLHERLDIEPDTAVMVLPRPRPRRCNGPSCVELGAHNRGCHR